jgi:hypothetical protein
MSNTYTFTIENTHHHTVGNRSQVIYSVDWILTATDGTNSAELQGSTAAPFDQTADFVDIDQLTDGIIVEWIINNTAVDTLEIHYKNLDTQLKLLKESE